MIEYTHFYNQVSSITARNVNVSKGTLDLYLQIIQK